MPSRKVKGLPSFGKPERITDYTAKPQPPTKQEAPQIRSAAPRYEFSALKSLLALFFGKCVAQHTPPPRGNVATFWPPCFGQGGHLLAMLPSFGNLAASDRHPPSVNWRVRAAPIHPWLIETAVAHYYA